MIWIVVVLIGVALFWWQGITRAERRQAWLKERGAWFHSRRWWPLRWRRFKVIELHGRKYIVRKRD